MSSEQFETLRLYMIIFVFLFKLAMMPKYLQSYLNLAYHKLEELKLEAGKITNVDVQKLIARVFYYLCVVTLQYIGKEHAIMFYSLKFIFTFIYSSHGYGFIFVLHVQNYGWRWNLEWK